MMTNLFSAFDPATSQNLSLNWMSMYIGMMMMPLSYWIMPNRINILIKKMLMILFMEFKMLMNMKSTGMTTLFVAMFMFILMNNMMGLLPYMFTTSSHMVFTLSMALPFWISLMMFGWINKTQMMFAHLIPSGTPIMLMPFMVCIETISNIIRPGALAVRLMANMIAGHLLMTLLGNSSMTANLTMMMLLLIQMFLMMFETAVAIIQAYVFSVLSTLYTSEVIYEKK